MYGLRHSHFQSRVFQGDGSPAGFLHRHQVVGPHEALVDIAPLPQKRPDGSLLHVAVPMAAEVSFRQPLIEFAQIHGILSHLTQIIHATASLKLIVPPPVSLYYARCRLS
jgi:hypothetical protein